MGMAAGHEKKKVWSGTREEREVGMDGKGRRTHRDKDGWTPEPLQSLRVA